MSKKNTDIEVPPEHPEDYTDPHCPRCDAIHFQVLGFTFAGEWRAEALMNLICSHPEYMDWLDDELKAN